MSGRHEFIDHLQEKRTKHLEALKECIFRVTIDKYPRYGDVVAEIPHIERHLYTVNVMYVLNDKRVYEMYANFLNACRQLDYAINTTSYSIWRGNYEKFDVR